MNAPIEVRLLRADRSGDGGFRALQGNAGFVSRRKTPAYDICSSRLLSDPNCKGKKMGSGILTESFIHFGLLSLLLMVDPSAIGQGSEFLESNMGATAHALYNFRWSSLYIIRLNPIN